MKDTDNKNPQAHPLECNACKEVRLSHLRLIARLRAENSDQGSEITRLVDLVTELQNKNNSLMKKEAL